MLLGKFIIYLVPSPKTIFAVFYEILFCMESWSGIFNKGPCLRLGSQLGPMRKEWTLQLVSLMGGFRELADSQGDAGTC